MRDFLSTIILHNRILRLSFRILNQKTATTEGQIIYNDFILI